MNELLGIQIPEDLSALSPEALSTLISDLKGAIRTALSGDVTPSVIEDAEKADGIIEQATAEVTTKAEAEAALAAKRDGLLSKFSDEAPADEDDEDEAPAAESDEDDEDESDEDEDDDADPAAVVASAWTPTLSAVKKAAKVKAPPAKAFNTFADIGFKAVSSVGDMTAGQQFENPSDLATALTDTFATIAGGNNKLAVARLSMDFPEDRILDVDPAKNIEKFGGIDPTSSQFQAVTAAFCAAPTPTHEFATSSSTARPVKNSLTVFRPGSVRGGATVYPSPTLSDVEEQDAGLGIWTSADDTDENAIKTCATIPCSTPELYELYGVYRCLKVKNLMAMTFPELVDAILNRLGALHSRLGEVTLLDAMLASVNTVAMNVDANAYGASINLLDTILRAVAIHREEERYDSGQRFDTWIPRWVMTSLQIDLANQRREGGSLRARLAPASDVNAALNEAGLNVTWTYDVATTWSTVPRSVDGQDLPFLPTNYDLIMTPAGNFKALDRGELTIGVTNGGIYRDQAANARNEFSIFRENFEGLIDFGAKTYALHIGGVCPGGAQTADVTSITCPATSGS